MRIWDLKNDHNTIRKCWLPVDHGCDYICDLSFRLQGGLERITKYMMSALLVLMLVLAIHSFTLSGARMGWLFI